MRVLFVGHQRQILSTLVQHCDYVLVYSKQPKFSIKRLKYWLSKFYSIRVVVKKLYEISPKFFKKAVRYLPKFQIEDFAIEHNLPVIRADNINHPILINMLSELNIELGIVANLDEILKPTLINSIKFGFINFHPSLLPKYRGPDPITWMIYNGEKQAGISWHKVQAKIDSGEIIYQKSFLINEGDTADDILQQSITLANNALPSLLVAFQNNCITSIPQNQAESSYFFKMPKQHKRALLKTHEGEQK